jgi:hypothetical protein
MAYNVTTMNQSLNLYNLFVNDISGSETMFIVLSLILFFLIMAKMRMPNVAVIILMILYALVMGAIFQSLLIIGALIVGIFFATAINRLIKT